MGNFYNYILRETIENPGEYHYTKFDDFLSGEKFDKESWLKSVYDYAEKFIKNLSSIKLLISSNVVRQSIPSKSYGTITSYIKHIQHDLEKIMSLVSLRNKNADMFRLSNIKRQLEFKNKPLGKNLVSLFLRPETQTQIEQADNFVEKIFTLLNSPEWNKQIIHHQVQYNNDIVKLSKNILNYFNDLKTKLPHVYSGWIENIYEFTEILNKVIDNLKDLSRGEKLQEFDRNIFYKVYFGLNRLSSSIAIKNNNEYNIVKIFRDKIQKDLKPLILSLDHEHGNLKTESYFLEGKSLFDIPLDKDPAHIHSISFDKAFGQGPYDIGTDESKNEWLKSVRDQAKFFDLQIAKLRLQMENQNTSIYKKKNPTGNELSNFRFYLNDLRELLYKIIHLSDTSHQNSAVRDLKSYTPTTGFGINLDWIDKHFINSENKISTKQILTPGAWKMLEKIENWCLTIANSGMQGRSEILNHIYQNHDNREKQFAKEILQLRKSLDEQIQKKQPEVFNHDTVQALNNIQQVLIGDQLSPWDIIKGIANRGVSERFIKQNKGAEKYLYPLEAFLVHTYANHMMLSRNSEVPEIKDLTITLRNKLKDLILALHRKFGNLK